MHADARDHGNVVLDFVGSSQVLGNFNNSFSCSPSYPSGNQVDGSPLVAITRRAGVFRMESNTKTIVKRARVGPRTSVLLTTKMLF